MPERETLEVDFLIVGAGPAGLAAAIRFHDLGASHTLAVIEKGAEIGTHQLSGAVMDPKALAELIPDYIAQGAPLESPVLEEQIYFLLQDECVILPFIPPPLENHGNYIVSLSRLTRWLGKQAQQRGIDLFTGFPGVDLLIENDTVVGVRTGDKGIGRNGQKKNNYEPGIDIRAKVTFIAEGTRGHLARIAFQKFGLDKDRNPQIYSTGVKEIWEFPPGHLVKGRVIHTMGWPLNNDAFGGGFVYSMSPNRLSIGFVVGLDYRDPFMDPHHEFQRFKTHPKIAALLEGGKMIEYGAKTIPVGGWFSVPRLTAPGLLIGGDAAGMCDPMRLKGIHTAIKAGMLGAETAFEALKKNDVGATFLKTYQTGVAESWIKKELWKSRYFKQGFTHGFLAGLVNAGVGTFTGGWNLFHNTKMAPGHTKMQKREVYHGDPNAEPIRLKFDDALTFSKPSDMYHSGTAHEEDSPCHLLVLEPDLCTTRCAEEYGNPCQHFCPAKVYEWVKADENDVGRLQINFANCVHCKTCDIMDPYGVIRWVPPEGGGGPGYRNL